ncbi:P-loop containing nucleoside triphosphate hydrolase protein [Phlyctochytrium arcticum]|nr:P-loop containing nucleoside triphosphate hydrolase protein [Phlyctochytrium arcticum]
MAAFPVEFPTIAGLAAQPQVKINVVDYGKVSAVHVKWLLNTSSKAASIGLDTEFDGHLLGLIQLATETRCLLIKVQKPGKGNPHKARTPNEALDDLFNDPTILKTGCELTKDALLLRSNFGHDIRGGIDLTQVYSPSDLDATERQTKGLFSLFSEMYLPDHRPLLKDKQTTTSRWVGVEFTPAQLSYGALDAWVSYKVGVHNLEKTLKAKALDFGNSKSGVLDCLMEQNSASLAVEDLKVKQYDSKFSKVTLRKDGAYEVLNTQFRNQLMFNDKVIVHFSNGINLPGKVSWGNYGKTKTVKLEKGVQAPRSSQVVKITVAEGGGNRGADEFLRDVFPKLVLHGLLDPTTIPMFNYLFLGKTKQIWPKAPPVYSLAKHKLNESQKRAVHTMLSDPKPINLIHGPPGTGKTYAITAAVAASITSKAQKSFYVLTCQTNAATRNLAVTLLKRGVSDFRIIVSDNFFVEWHEDQYKVIRDHVVQSLQTGNKEFENLIGPRTVVLCSLAQLSNPNLVSVFRARRVTHIVIDEASQISLVNIPHILALYATSLQRLTFVGDPKQLAPFGNEAHPGVESVFERLPADVMLNTQYRMPNDLGSFISRWVYKGRLLTEKKPRTQTSIALVNVEGATEVKSKTSFKVSVARSI